ncbi:MAG: DUF6159 family protein [Chloroflexota bacterium]|nr:DUF6159 family protein [Chloroflexota bacterium]
MNRIRRSWRLARASWTVLRTHRSLFVYPLVSAMVVAVLGGLLPFALAWVRLFDENVDPGLSVRGVVAFVLVYMMTFTVVLFCNVALVAEVIARFDGSPRAVPSGWSAARSELRGILAYAVFASTLVSVLSLVLSRAGRGLGILSLLLPASWSLGTFLAVPILVVERVGPREALERSASLLRATWGKQFLGTFGIFVIKWLLIVLVIVAGGLLIALTALTGFAPLVLLAVILVVAAVALVLVMGSAVTTVYSAATYRHVTNQPVPGFEALDALPDPIVTTEGVAEAPGVVR